MKKGTIRRLDALATDGVERSEPAGPPTAFRIWKAGANPTDHGPTVFSERSAALLLAEQAKRGNRYSIDVDHLSLDKDAPIENHAAVGWFSLAVRKGELWAVDVEWVNDTIRDGLTKGSWKYTSSAYDVNDAGEVVSFLNLAVTNNPATWGVTALASRGASIKKEASRMGAKAKKMSWGDIKAALDGDDENAKASAYAAIQAAFPEHSEPDGDEGKKDSDEEPEKKKDAADAADKKDAADDADEKDSEDDADKKASVAAALAEVNRLASRVRELEAKDEATERKTLLASRPDFAPELIKILEKAPMSMVREHVAKLPKTAAKTRSTEVVQATRGGHVDGVDAPRLPAEESRQLAERMGLRKADAKIGWDPNMKTTRVFPVLAGNAKKEGA